MWFIRDGRSSDLREAWSFTFLNPPHPTNAAATPLGLKPLVFTAAMFCKHPMFASDTSPTSVTPVSDTLICNNHYKRSSSTKGSVTDWLEGGWVFLSLLPVWGSVKSEREWANRSHWCMDTFSSRAWWAAYIAQQWRQVLGKWCKGIPGSRMFVTMSIWTMRARTCLWCLCSMICWLFRDDSSLVRWTRFLCLLFRPTWWRP